MANNPKLQVIVSRILKDTIDKEAKKRGMSTSEYSAMILNMFHILPICIIPDARAGYDKFSSFVDQALKLGGYSKGDEFRVEELMESDNDKIKLIIKEIVSAGSDEEGARLIMWFDSYAPNRWLDIAKEIRRYGK